MPAQLAVVGLVAVGQQTGVAAAGALLALRRPALVRAGVPVEVADLQGGFRGLGEGAPLVLDPAQHTGAALGGLREQHAAARPVVRRQQLRGQLGVLQLERRLDAPLHCVQERQRHRFGQRLVQRDDEDVAPVLHERQDPLLAPLLVAVLVDHRHAGALDGVCGGPVVEPATVAQVQPVAVQLPLLVADPAEIGDPDRGRVAVVQVEDGRAAGVGDM